MSEVERMVRAFHEHFGLPIGDTSRTTNEVRIRIVRQESAELVEALEMFDADPTLANLCAVAHESADVLFAVYGTAITLNYDADEAARRVFLAERAVVIREARWIVRCLRCTGVRSWAGPRGRHHRTNQQPDSEGGV